MITFILSLYINQRLSLAWMDRLFPMQFFSSIYFYLEIYFEMKNDNLHNFQNLENNHFSSSKTFFLNFLNRSYIFYLQHNVMYGLCNMSLKTPNIVWTRQLLDTLADLALTFIAFLTVWINYNKSLQRWTQTTKISSHTEIQN